MPSLRPSFAILSFFLLIAGHGCSLLYDSDDLRDKGDGDGTLGDASLGTPGGDDDDGTVDDGDGSGDTPDDGDDGDANDDDGTSTGDGGTSTGDGGTSTGDGGTDDGGDDTSDDTSDDSSDDSSDDTSDDGSEPPDAGVSVPDAAPPTDCGGTSEECCLEEPSCIGSWTECTAGTCNPCGGTLQSCCDPGATCRGLLNCVAGLCVL